MAKAGLGVFDWGVLPLRFVVGVVFVYHGFHKVFVGDLSQLAGSVGGMGFWPPMVWAVVLAMTELLGGLAVLAGFLTRLASVGLACVMAVAVLKVHWSHGFSAMNGGFEYPFTLLGAALTLLIVGGGRISLGSVLGKRP